MGGIPTSEPSRARQPKNLLCRPADAAPPPTKVDPGPTEVHSREQSQVRVLAEAAYPDLTEALTVHPACQEELYNPGRDVSINPNEDSILTP